MLVPALVGRGFPEHLVLKKNRLEIVAILVKVDGGFPVSWNYSEEEYEKVAILVKVDGGFPVTRKIRKDKSFLSRNPC